LEYNKQFQKEILGNHFSGSFNKVKGETSQPINLKASPTLAYKSNVPKGLD